MVWSCGAFRQIHIMILVGERVTRDCRARPTSICFGRQTTKRPRMRPTFDVFLWSRMRPGSVSFYYTFIPGDLKCGGCDLASPGSESLCVAFEAGGGLTLCDIPKQGRAGRAGASRAATAVLLAVGVGVPLLLAAQCAQAASLIPAHFT
eukprot:682518-Rhodomonas_salina.1